MATKKKGILIVPFGTTVSRAAEAFSRFDVTVKSRFSGREVRWAYTSSIVRRKLAVQGIVKQGVSEALSQFVADGYREIGILSLQTIPGYEYELIRHDVSSFLHTSTAEGVNIVVAKPLLSGYDDALSTAKALLKAAPSGRIAKDALVFMGHGSGCHEADLFYVAMASIICKLDPHAFLGTVEGHPTLDDIIMHCKHAGIRKAWLVPFMAIAGDHAINDMAGDNDDSWKTVLSKEGITCEAFLQGTLDNPNIAKIWLDHLEASIDKAESAVKRVDTVL